MRSNGPRTAGWLGVLGQDERALAQTDRTAVGSGARALRGRRRRPRARLAHQRRHERRLATGRRTRVQHVVAGLGVEGANDERRRLVLDREPSVREPWEHGGIATIDRGRTSDRAPRVVARRPSSRIASRNPSTEIMSVFTRRHSGAWVANAAAAASTSSIGSSRASSSTAQGARPGAHRDLVRRPNPPASDGLGGKALEGPRSRTLAPGRGPGPRSLPPRHVAPRR